MSDLYDMHISNQLYAGERGIASEIDEDVVEDPPQFFIFFPGDVEALDRLFVDGAVVRIVDEDIGVFLYEIVGNEGTAFFASLTSPPKGL